MNPSPELATASFFALLVTSWVGAGGIIKAFPIFPKVKFQVE
jgi:hypothetical protein